MSEGVADDPQADDPWFAPGPKKAVSPGDVDAYADAAPASPADASPADASPADASPAEQNTADQTTGNLTTADLTTGKLTTADLTTGETSQADEGAGMASAATDKHAGQADWFLRTGREGLHPDSVTSWDDASGEPPADHHEVRVAAAGAPPWAGETTAVSASTPPPWETGPWPGASALRSQGSRPAGDGQPGTPASGAAATAGQVGGIAAVSAHPDGAVAVATPVRWSARTLVTAGLIPLVVPGLVLGFLSLRQAGGEAVRKASWLAIGASIAWLVIIIVIVASVSGGSAGACNGYPAAVHQAYEKALTDLRGNAPASAAASDLQTAASLANSSAAGAGQIGVRDALFTMANDLAQARADVVAGRPISTSLRQHLAADGSVPAGSCAS